MREPSPVQCVLLECADIAAMLGCSKQTIWRMRDSGRMPASFRLSSRQKEKWLRAEIEVWIASRCEHVVRPAETQGDE